MNNAINYGYEDGISDALFDIVSHNIHHPVIDKSSIISKAYDYYYIEGYFKLINFVKQLFS